mmetsp:Transcript_20171/g.28915  ORF Transcript_20171/g.28915 Transcript_20171/m.28915 type:complete len:91 (+) Transcript_20171:2149-2421(+)
MPICLHLPDRFALPLPAPTTPPTAAFDEEEVLEVDPPGCPASNTTIKIPSAYDHIDVGLHEGIRALLVLVRANELVTANPMAASTDSSEP